MMAPQNSSTSPSNDPVSLRCRQPEHIEIAPVAYGNACKAVVDDEALRDIVDGGVEPLFLVAMLLRQFSNDEKQQGRDDQHREAGHDHQKSGLLPPIGQRWRNRRGRNDGNWKIAQGARGSQPVQTVDRAGQAHRAVIGLRQDLPVDLTGLKIPPDHFLDVRIAGQQRAIAVVHRNGGTLAERRGTEEILEMGRCNRSGDDTQKLAFWTGNLARDNGCPASAEAALHQFDQGGW
jgi:hypothetical protein